MIFFRCRLDLIGDGGIKNGFKQEGGRKKSQKRDEKVFNVMIFDCFGLEMKLWKFKKGKIPYLSSVSIFPSLLPIFLLPIY